MASAFGRKILVLLAAVAASAVIDAQAPRPAPAPAHDIEQLSWFTGCWRIVRVDQVIDEQWMAPSGGVMLGMSRTVRDGRTTAMEFVTLRIVDGRIVYEAHPSGQAPASFTATSVSTDRVVFENPAHDYPKRITYERRANDAISAWIDDGTGSRRIQYPFQRVVCTGSLTS